MRPHVGAVEGDENRDVADDADAERVGARLEGAPLLEEEVLAKGVEVHLLPKLGARPLDLIRLVRAQRRGPGRPQAVVLGEGGEDREVVEPGALRSTKGANALVHLRRLGGERLLQEHPFGHVQRAEVHPVLAQPGQVRAVGGGDQSVGDQQVG